MEIKKATRQGIKPLGVLYAESGCGKTFSALLLARGMAGPDGKVIVIDSENGRASLYADVPIFGGYDTIDLQEPFSPARYIEALNLAVNGGADVVVIDSGSHEWEGAGGILDQAAEREHRSGRAGLHNWKEPKFEHSKFIAAITRSKVPVIVCLRAKYKTRQVKDEKGKTVIIKDDYTSPIQAEDFIFEATWHGEILPDHSLRLTKHSHPSLKECFPVNKPVELKHGEMIAKWCAGSTVQQSTKSPKKQLWEMTSEIHGGNKDKLEKWLLDNNLLDPALSLSELSEKEVEAIVNLAGPKLKGK